MLKDCIAFLKSLGYDLVIVETAGIGQSDSEIVDLVDFPMYVMTSDFGAPSQLEKIDMLDFAELVVLNKFDKRGAEDALRDVRKQWKRNRVAFADEGRGRPGLPDHRQPVQRPRHQLDVRQPVPPAARKARPAGREVDAAPRHHAEGTARHRADPRRPRALPGRDRRTGPGHQRAHRIAEPKSPTARRATGNRCTTWATTALPKALDLYATDACTSADRHPRTRESQADAADRTLLTLRQRYNDAIHSLDSDALKLLRDWPARLKSITDEVTEYKVRDKTIRVENYRESLAHQKIPKIAAPTYKSWGELLTFLQKENLPGDYPYTGGVYPVPPHRRRPDPHVRRRRHARAHQPPLPLPERRPARRAPVHRVRLASRCTAKTPPCARTSTARSATPASTSPRSTT